MDEKIVARRSPVLSLSSIHNSASDVIIYQLRAIILSPLHGDDQKMTKKFLETPLRISTQSWKGVEIDEERDDVML